MIIILFIADFIFWKSLKNVNSFARLIRLTILCSNADSSIGDCHIWGRIRKFAVGHAHLLPEFTSIVVMLILETLLNLPQSLFVAISLVWQVFTLPFYPLFTLI